MNMLFSEWDDDPIYNVPPPPERKAQVTGGNDEGLYPFQIDAKEALRAKVRTGRRAVVLSMPTGAGKTRTIGSTIADCIDKGGRSLMITDRIALVDQSSEHFMAQGIEHGVIRAGSFRGAGMPLQIASAQTLERWNSIPINYELVVVDECHTRRKRIDDMIKARTEAGKVSIGLSATAFTGGVGDVYQDVVNGATTYQLQKEGYLSGLRVFNVTDVDMSGVKATGVGGEWSDRQCETAVARIAGDIVDDWIRVTNREFGGPVKTLVFIPTVDFGGEICERFQKAGYDFRLGSYRDDDADSARKVAGFRQGRFTGLVCVDKFIKGFDVPDTMCLVAARPFKKSLHAIIQQYGRVMRSAPGKKNACIIDHCGNHNAFRPDIEHFFRNGVTELVGKDGERKYKRREFDKKDVQCMECGFALEPGVANCPACGAARPRRARTVLEVKGVLNEGQDVHSAADDWKVDRFAVWIDVCRIMSRQMWRCTDTQAGRRAWAIYRDIMGTPPDIKWRFERDPYRKPSSKVRKAVMDSTKRYQQRMKRKAQ